MRTALKSHVATRQFHVTCLARSFSSYKLQCPLCNQSLAEFSRSSSISASSLFHGCMIDVESPPTNRGLNSMVRPAGFPPRPETPEFLCCRRIGPPPQFEPSNDRRMGWSPSPKAHFSEWAVEWLCVGCSRTVDLSHAPPSDAPPCPQCSNVPKMVVDVAASQHWFWCPRCQRRLEACVVEPPIPQGESVALPATPGPIEPHGTSLRLGRSPCYSPRQRSWLLCPLISLVLAGAERAHGVPLHSSGPRQQVPPDQERFWLSTAQDIIDSLIARFRTFHPNLQLLWNCRDQIRGQEVIICLRVCRRDVSPGTYLKH